MNQLFCKQLAAFSLSLLASSAILAEQKWYQIEIIAFKFDDQSAIETEHWPKQQPLEFANAVDFLSPNPAEKPIEKICLDGQWVAINSQQILPEYIEPVEALETNIERQVNELATNSSAAEQAQEVEPLTDEQILELATPYQIIDSEYRELNQTYQNLTRRGGFTTLIHLAWAQPLVSMAEKQPIRVFAGTNYGDSYTEDGTEHLSLLSNQQLVTPVVEQPSADELFANELSADFQDLEQQTVSSVEACQQLYAQEAFETHDNVWQLDGVITPYLSNYLHIEADLMLRVPGEQVVELDALATDLAAEQLASMLTNSQQSQPEQAPKEQNNPFSWQFDDSFLQPQSANTVIQKVLNGYRLQNSIRVQKEKAYYMDHPLFGLLIFVKDLQPEAVILPEEVADNSSAP